MDTARIITEEGLERYQRYYSIYRGIVVDNKDELHCNRLKVIVPDVMSGVCNWAYPKGQHGSIQSGFKFLSPKIGDVVWVTFEYGNPSKPVWEYHGWSEAQIPNVLDDPNKMGIVTPNGNLILIEDDEGVINIYAQGTIQVTAKEGVVVYSKDIVNIQADQSIILNDGKNQGLIKVKELTERLNQTIQELESLRNTFNTHIHAGVTAGPGSTGPTATPVSKPFSTFKQEDYENTKILQ